MELCLSFCTTPVPKARHVKARQEGYGAFSVSASNVEAVRHYIEHQAEHHSRHSFEDEFVSLLRKSGVKYDPEFVFG
jgi:putative transposase